MTADWRGFDTASADVMLGRSVENLFDANETSVPQTGSRTASSIDSLFNVLSSLSTSPLISVSDAVALLTRPRTYVDKAAIDARQVSTMHAQISSNVFIVIYIFDDLFTRWEIIFRCSFQFTLLTSSALLHVRRTSAGTITQVLNAMLC